MTQLVALQLQQLKLYVLAATCVLINIPLYLSDWWTVFFLYVMVMDFTVNVTNSYGYSFYVSDVTNAAVSRWIAIPVRRTYFQIIKITTIMLERKEQ